jgi:hypothetical protein
MLASDLAAWFRLALEHEDAEIVRAHEEGLKDQEVYLEAWFTLDSAARTEIKRVLEAAKHPHVDRETDLMWFLEC